MKKEKYTGLTEFDVSGHQLSTRLAFNGYSNTCYRIAYVLECSQTLYSQ